MIETIITDRAQMKRFETLRAQMAMKGIALYIVDDGFIVIKWGMSRHLRDLDAVIAFGASMGVTLS